MPNIVSNKKHLRKSKKAFIKNKAVKSKVKTLYKKVIDSLTNQEQAKKQLSLFFRVADKAALKGILKRNTVARKKSNLAKKILKNKDISKEE